MAQLTHAVERSRGLEFRASAPPPNAGKMVASLSAAIAPLCVAMTSAGGPRLVSVAIVALATFLPLATWYLPAAKTSLQIGLGVLLAAVLAWVPFGSAAFVVDYWSLLVVGVLSLVTSPQSDRGDLAHV